MAGRVSTGLFNHLPFVSTASAVYEAFLFARQDWDFRKVTMLRWIVNFFIGTIVALVGGWVGGGWGIIKPTEITRS